jgi:hypothetical protein
MPSVSDITQKVLDAPLVYTENERYVFPDSVEDNPKIGRPVICRADISQCSAAFLERCGNTPKLSSARMKSTISK